MWLSSVASLKGQLFGSFFLDAWEEMEKSNRSQREKEEMEMGLRIEHDRSGAEYHADMAMLVDLAVTPDTAVLKKEAHVLFDKWTDRFPQGPGPVPTKDDLEQLGREAKALFDQTKKLPRISREQLEAEIAALPPIPGQKGTPMYVR